MGKVSVYFMALCGCLKKEEKKAKEKRKELRSERERGKELKDRKN